MAFKYSQTLVLKLAILVYKLQLFGTRHVIYYFRKKSEQMTGKHRSRCFGIMGDRD
jgi:hypothetical protein